MVVLVRGNLSLGFNLVGPFDNYDDAFEWDDDHSDGRSYAMTLLTPTEVEEEQRAFVATEAPEEVSDETDSPCGGGLPG